MTDGFGNVFYRKELMRQGDGFNIVTEKYKCIHETKCYYYCVPSFLFDSTEDYYKSKENVKTDIKWARKIDKRGSKIAFSTEKEAMDNLIYRKKYRLFFLNKEADFLVKFLSNVEGGNEEKKDSLQIRLNGL